MKFILSGIGTPILLLCLLLISFSSFSQNYVLSDDDVVVEEGILLSISDELEYTDITIPNFLDGQTVIAIADGNWNTGIFYQRGLIRVTFPESIEVIGDNAFSENAIEELDFSRCTKLKTIGTGAFFANNISSIDLDSCTSLLKIGESSFAANSIENLDLNKCVSLMEISVNAFSGNPVSTLNISSCTSLCLIGKRAFNNSNLTAFNLPEFQNSSRHFLYWSNGYQTFENGGSVTDVKTGYYAVFQADYKPLEEELLLVDSVIVGHSINLEIHPDVILPDSIDGVPVIGIADSLFFRADIYSVVLPASLMYIGKHAFGRSKLSSADFKACSKMQTIDQYAFYMNNLTALDLTECKSLKKINKSSFFRNDLVNLDFSGNPNLEFIGQDAFYENLLVTVNFENCTKLEMIENGAFKVNDIVSVDLSPCVSMIFIGPDAFRYNELTSFNLPSPTFDDFKGWKDDNNVTYDGGDEVTDLGSFYKMSGTYILTDKDVVVENGAIVSCSYDFFQTDIIIPEILDGQLVKAITDGDYKNGVFKSKEISSIVLPTTIQNIGDYAFAYNNIMSLDLTRCTNLRSIGRFAFNSNKLDTLNFSTNAKLKYIGEWAFRSNTIGELNLSGCKKLASIGKEAFAANKLEIVLLDSCISLANIGQNAFDKNRLSELVLPYYAGENRIFITWTDGNRFIEPGEVVTNFNSRYFATFEPSYAPKPGELTVENGLVVSHKIDLSEHPDIIIPDYYQGEKIIGLGKHLFYQSELSSLSLPSTLQYIQEEGVSSNQLATLDMSKCTQLKYIGKLAFFRNEILDLSFEGCDSLKVIDWAAFSSNALQDLDFEGCKSLMIIRNGAFSGNNLKSLNFGSCTNLISIDAYAFNGNDIGSFSLPDSTFFNGTFISWIDDENKSYEAGDEVFNFVVGYRALLGEETQFLLMDELNFGEVEQGESKMLEFFVYNHSNQNIQLSDIVLPEGFSEFHNFSPIGPWGARNIRVTFSPVENKNYNGFALVNLEHTEYPLKIKLNTKVKGYYNITFWAQSATEMIDDFNIELENYGTKDSDDKGTVMFTDIQPADSIAYRVESKGFDDVYGYVSFNDSNILDTIMMVPSLFDVSIVFSDGNNFVEGVEVTLEAHDTLKTDSLGVVSYVDLFYADSLQLTASKEGYDTLMVYLPLVEDISLELVLSQIYFQVTFSVHDSVGAIANARVTIGEGKALYTDEIGNAVFDSISFPYSVSYVVSADGYFDTNGEISLTNNDVIVDVILVRDNTAKTRMQNLEMVVYPNPTSQFLTLRGAEGEACIQQLSGVVIKKVFIDKRDNTIDLSDLPKGMYLLKLNGKVVKFLLQ